MGVRRVGGPTQKKWGPEGWGFEGWGAQPRKSGGPKGGGPKCGGPNCGGPKGGEPKISRFFSCPAAKFVLFFPLWGSSRGILVVFEAPGRSNVHVWALGLSCASPGGPVWWGRRGSTRQPESPNMHISASRSSKHHQNSTRRPPRERQKQRNGGGKGKKKREILGGPGEGRPREGRSREHRT